MAPVNSVSRKHSQRPISFLVLTASSTLEKIEQLNIIARMRGLPILFLDIREVGGAFHSDEETDADRALHAEGKLRQVREIIMAARDRGSQIYAVLEKVCEKRGIPFVLDNIFVLTDDNDGKMTPALWSAFRDMIAPAIGDELLQRAEGWKPGTAKPHYLRPGPASEIGPMSAAVGYRRYSQIAAAAVIAAAAEAGSNSPPILPLSAYREEVTVFLVRLGDSPTAPLKKLEAGTDFILLDPDAQDIAGPSQKLFAQPDQFLAHVNTPRTPLADRKDDFLHNESPRGAIVTQIMSHAPLPESGKPIAINFGQAGPHVVSRKRFRIANPIGERIRLEGFAAPKISLPEGPHVAHIMTHAHAVVFPPFDAGDLPLRRRNYDLAQSILLDKKLHSPDIGKPILFLDDGSWHPFFRIYGERISNGMSKDYLREPLICSPGVTHIATGYFDILRSDHNRLMQNAAALVLEHGRKRFFTSSLGHAPPLPPPGGTLPLFMPPVVTIYTTASNENLTLTQDLGFLGELLARLRAGLKWGGMDQHAPRELYDRYRNAGGPLLIGISTPELVTAETRTGNMPECDYWEFTPTLTKRRQRLMDADIAVAAPGGEGTDHEIFGELVEKDNPNSRYYDRPLVLYNPDLYAATGYAGGLYFDTMLRSFMGDEFTDLITASHRAFAHRGIYMPTTRDELADLLTEELLPQCVQQHAVARSRMGRPQQFSRRL